MTVMVERTSKPVFLVKLPAPSLNKNYQSGAGLYTVRGAPILMNGAKIFLRTKTTALTTVRPTAAIRICAMEQRYLWQASLPSWHAHWWLFIAKPGRIVTGR